MNSKFRILLTNIFLHFIMNNSLCTNTTRRSALRLCGAKIGKGTFIGMNSLICKPVTIGSNICIGGRIITNDFPSNSICAGVPYRVIKFIGQEQTV